MPDGMPRVRMEDIKTLLEAGMPEGTNAPGSAMMTAAIALIRETKSDVANALDKVETNVAGALNKVEANIATILRKMEDADNERRKEAYEKGQQDQRLDQLEAALGRHKEEHAKTKMWLFGIGGTLITATMVGFAILFLKLIAYFPALAPK